MGERGGESIRWLRHDADLLLEARAATEERLFALAAEAVVAAMTDRPPTEGGERRSVRLEAEDPEGLFVAWLNEIVYLVTAGDFLPARFPSLTVEEGSLSAEIEGGAPGPNGPSIVREVKAATYHRLRLSKGKEGWTARVLLDV
ncbi:MAG: archease [Candidatus Eisenbacteria bacterium]